MNDKVSVNNLDIDSFKEDGLYIILPDGKLISLTPTIINEYFKKCWEDDSYFPPHIKSATEMDFCVHCPGKDLGEEFCVAFKPIMPILEAVDEFVSYDRVTTIIKSSNPNLLSISETDLQNALQHVVVMSMIKYCETNQYFWPYYFGVNLLMDPEHVLTQIYINMFWLNKGDKNKTKKVANKFRHHIKISDECLFKRLKMVCKNDAFLNAFLICQVSTELFNIEMEDIMETSFEKHNKRLQELHESLHLSGPLKV